MTPKKFPRRLDSKTSCLRITVPDNLDLALEGLIRKVLREQPKTEDIYSFAANYFETLLKIRDKADTKSKGAQLCPFHDDEEAREMIIMAGTFSTKVGEGLRSKQEGPTPLKVKTLESKGEVEKAALRKGLKKEDLKPKPEKKQKQATPDLIKKLPLLGESPPEGEKPTAEEAKEGSVEEEFITADPIKELVEKEIFLTENSSEKLMGGTGPGAGRHPEESSPKAIYRKADVDGMPWTEEDVRTPTFVLPASIGGGQSSAEEETESSEGVDRVTDTKQKINRETEQGHEKGEEAAQLAGGAEKKTEDTVPLREAQDEISKEVQQEEQSDKKDEQEPAKLLSKEGSQKEIESGPMNVDTVVVPMPIQPLEASEKKLIQYETSKGSNDVKQDLEEQNMTQSQTALPPEKEFERGGEALEEGRQTENKSTEVQHSVKSTGGNSRISTGIGTKALVENSPDAFTTEREKSHTQKEEEKATRGTDMHTDRTPKDDVGVQENRETKSGAVSEEEFPEKGVADEEAESREVESNVEAQDREGEYKESKEPSATETKDVIEEQARIEDFTSTSDPVGSNQDKVTLPLLAPGREDGKSEVSGANVGSDAVRADNTEKSKQVFGGGKSNEEKKLIEEKGPKNEDSGKPPNPELQLSLKEFENRSHEVSGGKSTLEDALNGEAEILRRRNQEPDSVGLGESEASMGPEEELCTVVDILHIPKEQSTDHTEEHRAPNTQAKARRKDSNGVPVSPNEFEAKDTATTENEEESEPSSTKAAGEEPVESEVGGQKEVVEVATLDALALGTQQASDPEGKHRSEPEEIGTPTNGRHIVIVEEPAEPEAIPSTGEVQIKTIQTHYYDALSVPEVVTREYRVRGVTKSSALDLDEERQSPDFQPPEVTEETSASPAPTGSLASYPGATDPRRPADVAVESPDFAGALGPADRTTPSSAVTLSKLDMKTAIGTFLSNERLFSSLEKEDIRLVTRQPAEPDDQNLNDSDQEIDGTIRETTAPFTAEIYPESDASLLPRRRSDDLPRSTEGSACSRAADGGVPPLDDSTRTRKTGSGSSVEGEDVPGRRPEADIESQARAQADRISSDEKTVEGNDLECGTGEVGDELALLPTKEATVGECSSSESLSTTSSAATEIKRVDSGKTRLATPRTFSSARSFDLGKRNPLVRTRSLSIHRRGVADFEVWSTIEKELEEAATKIQSKYRGYKTRKILRRENAMQITTEESSTRTTPVEAELEPEGEDECQRGTGEFHDGIVLSDHPR